MFDWEEWRPVVGYEGAYQVSNTGRVRSLDRVVTTKAGWETVRRGQVRMLSPGKVGHLYVGLYSANRLKSWPVHQLVLLAFVGPRPENMEGCHNNGVANDNRVENLRWGTRSENILDNVLHGKHWQARKTECKWGHEYTPENTARQASGRYCRQCAKERHRVRRVAVKLGTRAA